MTATLPSCRDCGGALQRIASMPGHVVCGSGHLFLEQDAVKNASRPALEGAAQLRRVGGERGASSKS